MKTCSREKSLNMFAVFKMFFFENLLVHVHILYFSLISQSTRRTMVELASNVRDPKRVGGRTKIRNNCEGLSEGVIIEKNLRTPEHTDEEDQNTRDNSLQMIRRLQTLWWYEYKHIIPQWERLLALKNPWYDVIALKPGWTREERGDPPANAAASTL